MKFPGLVRLAVLGGLLGGQASAAEPVPSASRFPQLERFRLPGSDEDLWRGRLTVFENRTTRTGRTIQLNVVVVPSLDSTDVREPFFELAGGPGLAITASAGLYANDLKDYRRHRDIEARADLTQYTTAIAMDDLDDVRAWLGYEKINLYGFSYGSRAALVYLRQYPEHVRSVILMGVSPPWQHLPLYHARDGQRALDLLFDECLRDPIAGAVFPHIREELATVLGSLARQPATVHYVSRDQLTQANVVIQRDVFAETLRKLLYNADTARRIPLIVHAAASGDFGPYLASAIPNDRSHPNPIADGMYLSVTAAEDAPFIDFAAAEKLNAGNIFGNYRVFQQTRACALWPRAKIPADFGEPIKSAVPVLLVSGNLDPVTPPEWAESVARHLTNSRHVVLPSGAHLPDALSNMEKLDEVFLAFLDNPDPRKLDVSGLAKMQPPPFSVK